MINRRQALVATGGFFAFASQHHAARLFASTPTGTAKRCLVLWMAGGPSQLETFDPKPGTDTGGPTKAISTTVAGMTLAENLPLLAKQAEHLAVLRNITSEEGEHFRATYYLHTGYRQVPGFPRPALGSVVSQATAPAAFPKNVTIGGQGFGPAFLGLEHAPFSIEDPAAALEVLQRLKRRSRRLELIQNLGSEFDRAHPAKPLRQRSAMLSQLKSLLGTGFVDALDLQREAENIRSRYGDGEFADNCILARRLLEAGVNFVEVRHDGWDTHTDNFVATRNLCHQIDRAITSLLLDLKSSGMLDETLVVWMGEFGRTPVINANGGRDHFPTVTPVVLAGAGIRGGSVVGATNRTGSAIEGPSRPVADLFATMFAKLGIAPDTEFTTDFGAPTSITDNGRVIHEL